MQQMGGILHSDPLLITLEGKYDPLTGTILANTTAAPNNRKDYIVAGTMQGLLHMVDQKTGEEAFTFLPNEIVQDTDRRDALLDISNTQKITTNPYYGIDAPWASWIEYKVNSTSNKFVADKANIYGGMRMGGSSYYGLDVKDPTSPKFLFQIDPVSGTIKSSTSSANTTTANAAIQAMGQSWSKPTLANIRFNNQVRKVMIVGGGYDPVYEINGYQPATDLGGSPSEPDVQVDIVTDNSLEPIYTEKKQISSVPVMINEAEYNKKVDEGISIVRGEMTSKEEPDNNKKNEKEVILSGNTKIEKIKEFTKIIATTPVTETKIEYSKSCSGTEWRGSCYGKILAIPILKLLPKLAITS